MGSIGTAEVSLIDEEVSVATGEKQSASRYFLSLIYPPPESIDEEDVIRVVEELAKVGTTPDRTELDLILQSSGGDIYAAYKIVNIIRSRCSKLRVVVPLYAKSAATLMALGGDDIVMGPQSELGPLDIQLEHPVAEGISISGLDGVRPLEYLAGVSTGIAYSLGALIRQKIGLGRKESIEIALAFAGDYVRPIVSKLDPAVISICQRQLQIAEVYGIEFLVRYSLDRNLSNIDEVARSVSKKLVWEYPSHGFAICAQEARRLHLNVLDYGTYDMWDCAWKFFLSMRSTDRKMVALMNSEEFTRATTTLASNAMCPTNELEDGRDTST